MLNRLRGIFFRATTPTAQDAKSEAEAITAVPVVRKIRKVKTKPAKAKATSSKKLKGSKKDKVKKQQKTFRKNLSARLAKNIRGKKSLVHSFVRDPSGELMIRSEKPLELMTEQEN